MDTAESGNAEALERALAAEGLGGRVEARGRLAVIKAGPSTEIEGGTRRRLVSLARQHGFTNLAVELAADDADLPGD